MDSRTELAARFAGLSQSLLGRRADPVSFEMVAHRAVEVVPGCRWAGITMFGRGAQGTSVGSTGPVAARLDELQHALKEGPCLEAARDDTDCISPDLEAEPRWPAWSGEARALGVGSVLSVRLHTENETLGALNLYASCPPTSSTPRHSRSPPSSRSTPPVLWSRPSSSPGSGPRCSPGT